MIFNVVDTNIAVVANNQAPQADPDCVLACVNALEQIVKHEGICLDSGMRIIEEYLGNLSLSGQPGAGDAFMKWVWQNQGNRRICEQVEITALDESGQNFKEFPQDSRLAKFHRKDKKFVAVASASKNNPKVLNAVDSNWWDYRKILNENGIQIKFLCPEQFG